VELLPRENIRQVSTGRDTTRSDAASFRLREARWPERKRDPGCGVSSASTPHSGYPSPGIAFRRPGMGLAHASGRMRMALAQDHRVSQGAGTRRGGADRAGVRRIHPRTGTRRSDQLQVRIDLARAHRRQPASATSSICAGVGLVAVGSRGRGPRATADAARAERRGRWPIQGMLSDSRSNLRIACGAADRGVNGYSGFRIHATAGG